MPCTSSSTDRAGHLCDKRGHDGVARVHGNIDLAGPCISGLSSRWAGGAMGLQAGFLDRLFGWMWKARSQKAPPPPLTTEEVLRQEAEAIHHADLTGQEKDDLYRSLNALNSAALCLSGGGIRSAAFALGVIQALAAHPRRPDGNPVATPEQSLLSKFHYLSTVSGGGYIGSWLSAWLARTGFSTVWRSLVGRPAGPDDEPAPIGWLRSYSN